MGFKIQMAPVSQEQMKDIRESRPSGRYDGPTPPPGVYDVKIARAWFGETKAGNSTLKVALKFENEGEDAVYNGFDFINSYGIPSDPSLPSFTPQVNQLDDFFIAISGGKMGYAEFRAAMESGKNDVDPAKKNKMGVPVSQIGSVKLVSEKKIRIKTRFREWNGNEYVDLHYILRNENNKEAKSEESLDDFTDGDSEDSLEEWLNS